jgi:hypothetical protein
MKKHLLLPLATLLTACSLLGGTSADKTTPPQQPNAAASQLIPYTDERGMSDPRKIGTGGENIYGFSAPSGTDILLQQNAADLVRDNMKQRLVHEGYQIVDANPMFTLGGTIKELSYNIKARDEINIVIQSELREAASGKLLWAGVVTEREDHFAGVSGNSMGDVLKYLNKELDIVTKKTSDAIGAVLMAQHAELFNIVPGTKAIPGVTVLNAAPAAAAPAPAASTGGTGTLTLNTTPQRAKVTIDDIYYGVTPLTLELSADIHNVVLQLDGYQTITQKVSVRKGANTSFEQKFKK